MNHSKKVYKHLNNVSVVSKKSIKILMLAIAFMFSGLVSADNDPKPSNEAVTNIISVEIGKLLKNPKFSISEDVTAQVKVIINDDNQLVVLSVSSESEILESFIKSRLNYHELSVKMKTGQKRFLVPVRIVQE